jgi:NADH-quinone oxidoreductase subunit N
MFLNSGAIEKLETNLIVDLNAFSPEIILCGAIVLFLLLRLLTSFKHVHMSWVALVFTLLALAVSWVQWAGPVHVNLGFYEFELPFRQPADLGGQANAHDIFGGLLAFDNFTIFVRILLLSFTTLVIWLSMLTGIPDREDSADFYCLLLGATLGMTLMAWANHLLMVYIAVEMASLPSYALAGFLKGKRQSSEAALKYVVYGGGASGIMLYGISLIAGKFGTAYLPDLAEVYFRALQHGAAASTLGFDPILLLGTLFILIGVGFKLAAVPFHFWCPDVFEGAAAEVAAFLSVASKGAALALAGRLVLVLVCLTTKHQRVPADPFEAWLTVAQFLAPGLAIFAALTATFGNFAAYLQTNLKRLLAYSTIAHAGYMLMALAPLSREGASAVLFYLIAYLFMNLGAFAIVAFLRNETGSEDLSSYRGMIQRSPLWTVLLAIFLLSLLGIPPLAGFAAKWQVFSVLFDSGRAYEAVEKTRTLGYIMYALVAIAGLNTVLSAVYYLKVLKVMILDKPEGAEEGPVPAPAGPALYGTVLAVMIFVVLPAWDPLSRASDQGVKRFSAVPTPKKVEAQP